MPFFEKLIFGALGGGVLGIVVAVTSLFQGESFSKAGELLISGIALGVIVVFWLTRNQDDGDQGRPVDRDISKLRSDLQTAHHYAASFAADGKHHDAAYWRSQIAVIESQLRSRGA